ncbi:MAG: MATE family efflux transporter [Geminicoccaceae bacterium]
MSARQETEALLSLGLPLALTQLGHIAIGTTDTLMLGRLDAQSLAAGGLGMAILHIPVLFGFGVVSAVSPMVAHALGSRRPRTARRTVRQGLWITFLVTTPAIALLWFSEPWLQAIGQSPEIARDVQIYLRSAGFGVVSAVGFVALRGFVTAFGHTRSILIIQFCAIPLNALINYLLIFGNFGFPRLEIAGAGIASTLVNSFTFLALLAVAVWRRPYRRYAVLNRFWRPDWSTFASILRLGLPIGVTLIMEVGIFAGAGIMMGWIGTIELAAHQVAIQIAAVTFMVPLGLAQAATIRVALHGGAGRPTHRLMAGRVSLVVAAGFMAVAAITIALFAETLASLYLGAEIPNRSVVLETAVLYLMVVAAFQLFDGLQVVGLGVLRGLSDTRVPMIFALVGYWLIGMPASAILAFVVDWQGTGLLIGLVIGLAVVAVSTIIRFERLAGHDRPALQREAVS